MFQTLIPQFHKMGGNALPTASCIIAHNDEAFLPVCQLASLVLPTSFGLYSAILERRRSAGGN
jgi:hypothetical protein